MNKCLKEFQNKLEQPKETPKVKNESDTQRQNSQIESLSDQDGPTLSLMPKLDIQPPSPCVTVIDISSGEEEGVKPSITNLLINIKKGKNLTNTEKEPSDTEKEVILRAKINLMNRRMYTTGNTLLMAIEVIRDKYEEANVFVAFPEAAQIILSWNPNEGWFRFTRIFYSTQVCHRNPNGLYNIIPIFSGETTLGHWLVIAIEKNRRRQVAVILDSLGTGSLNTPIVNLVSQAFQPNTRGRVIWRNPECKRQTGIECRARTMYAMDSLAKAYHEKVDFEENVRRVTLWSPTEYDQMDIRRAVATSIQAYRGHMKSRAIRLRQWR